MPAEHPLYSKLARTLDLSEAEAAAVRAIPVGSVLFKADQIISREGDQPTRSCLVLEGVACTSKVVAGGKRQIMALHVAGDGPDLHSLHLRFLDSDIWAVSDCRLAFMAHKDLRAFNRPLPVSARTCGAPPWWRPQSTGSGWSTWASAGPRAAWLTSSARRC